MALGVCIVVILAQWGCVGDIKDLEEVHKGIMNKLK